MSNNIIWNSCLGLLYKRRNKTAKIRFGGYVNYSIHQGLIYIATYLIIISVQYYLQLIDNGLLYYQILFDIQWTPSNLATFGASRSVLIRGVASFQGWIYIKDIGVVSFQGSFTVHTYPGFENKEKAYRDLPEALLHWKVALEVVRRVVY